MLGKKNMGLVLAGLCMVFLIFVFAVSAAQAESVTLNYSLPWPATHGNTLVATEWAKEVEKRTNGAVKINTFPGGTLTPLDQTYDGVVKGICDIGLSVVSYVKGRFPLSEVIDLPLGYTSGLQATRLSNAYFEKFKPKEFEDVKMLYLHAHGPGLLLSKTPVKKLEDLKGMKIRCTGTSLKVVTALGGAPVAMPQTETYDALQKGVVDGVLSPMETLQGWKFA
jgi:TRAP-type C4-dicarboxylate transport system substrate-binding protein